MRAHLLIVAACVACSGKTTTPPSNTNLPDTEGVELDTAEELPKCDARVSKGPWSLAVTQKSAKIRWESCLAGGGGITLVEEGAVGPEKKLPSTVRETKVTTTNDVPLARDADFAGTFFMHEVALDGLEPGSCHRYAIDGEPAAKGRICTAKPSGTQFSFAAIGDTNPGLGDIDKLLETTYSLQPDFTIHGGDIQYYSSGLETYGFWMQKMAPMLRTGAFFPAIGNHEMEKPHEREEYIDRFWGGAGFDGSLIDGYYRFEWGGVWFFALNTEIELGDKSVQGTWLAEKLEDAAKRPDYRFSVVYLHRPFVTCGDSGQNDALRARYAPLFAKTKVKLVVQAHMHGYERFELDDITWITSAGGGSRLGNVDENITRPECTKRVASGRYWNATYFLVRPTMLSAKTFDDRGNVKDTFEKTVFP